MYFFHSDEPDGTEDFFDKISSIRVKYEDSEKKNIRDFRFIGDVVDGQLSDQIWPTLGGWNVSEFFKS